MKDLLSRTILPHYCCSCGEIGSILCAYCKYDIVSDLTAQCFLCLRPAAQAGTICSVCARTAHFDHGWFVGSHAGVLRELLMRYKFERLRSAAVVIADLLAAATPDLPPDMVVTWVPTVRSHVRQRGYDHAALLAAEFAGAKKLPHAAALARAGNTTQRGATRAERLAQAARAFIPQRVAPRPYLLIDDVATTCASVNAAAKALKDGGATAVWVLTLTREPLD